MIKHAAGSIEAFSRVRINRNVQAMLQSNVCADHFPSAASVTRSVPAIKKNAMSQNHETLFLVDGTAYVYRAFHAVRNLSNSQGEPSGAIYGFANMMNRIIKDQSPTYLVVVFDAKGPTFRDELYAEYKANRAPMPDELRGQYDVIRELVPAMGIASISIEGVEADDVIGTLAVAAGRKDLFTVIASGDKDLAQLVNDRVVMRDELREQELDTKGVKQKFGVMPEQIVDYLSLIGDKSDNIPGVELVGGKTAAKWLDAFGSLDNIIAQAHALPGKAGENLRNSLDGLALAKQLITLKTDVDVALDLDEFSISRPDLDALRSIYARFEFNTWLRVLDQADSQKSKQIERCVILDRQELDDMVDVLAEAGSFAIDTETTGLDIFDCELVGISICCDPAKAYYIPFEHRHLNAPAQLERAEVLYRLKPLLDDSSIVKIFHNLKFDAAILERYDMPIKGGLHDTMLQSYVLNSTAVQQHSMDNLALKYLDRTVTSYEEVVGKGKDQLTFDQVEIPDAADYAAEDAEITLLLHRTLNSQLTQNSELNQVYETIEMPLVPVLRRMETVGVIVDPEALNRQSAELAEQMQTIQDRIYSSAGAVFNISSPKQIQDVLFNQLGMPVVKKTSTGQPSTSEDALDELARIYDVPRLILEYRGLSKLKSTYTDKLAGLISPRTGRVHTSYNQAVAATGRLSSTNPNLQNIPIRTAEGRRVREAFVPDAGCCMLAVDYSQIELRLMAHLSQEPALLDAFSRGEDVHRATAAEVFDIPIDEVAPEQRRNAKAINFGLMYGMSAYGLSRQLRIGQSEAKQFIDQYFGRYPQVEVYMKNSRDMARQNSYVETLCHRRLHVPHINSRNFSVRQHAERTAINAPLQGSAADIIKLAMIEVDRFLLESNSDARMIMQVHDELVFEVPNSDLPSVRSAVCDVMESVIALSVPLKVEAGHGANFAEAHA